MEGGEEFADEKVAWPGIVEDSTVEDDEGVVDEDIWYGATIEKVVVYWIPGMISIIVHFFFRLLPWLVEPIVLHQFGLDHLNVAPVGLLVVFITQTCFMQTYA